MDYKKTIIDIKQKLKLELSKDEQDYIDTKKVELQEEPKKEEATAQPQFASMEQLSAMRDELTSFKNEVAEMLSAFAENINKTEKNKVPVEASKETAEEESAGEEVKEDITSLKKEDVKEDKVEMTAETVKHDPEAIEKKAPVLNSVQGTHNMTTKDVVFAKLFGQKLIYNGNHTLKGHSIHKVNP